MRNDPCKKEREEYNAAYIYRRKVFKEVGLEVKETNEDEIYTYIKGADSLHGIKDKKVKAALERLKKADDAFDDCLKKHKDWS